jgi:hypothetical protein
MLYESFKRDFFSYLHIIKTNCYTRSHTHILLLKTIQRNWQPRVHKTKIDITTTLQKNGQPKEHKSKNNFNDLKARISTACQNAKDNQHTNVNELVEYLHNDTHFLVFLSVQYHPWSFDILNARPYQKRNKPYHRDCLIFLLLSKDQG